MANREEELLRQTAKGSQEAFEELYESYKKPIANMLYRMCFDRTLVDDLLQEVFVRLWRGAGSFKGQSKVSTFVFRIAYNVYINEARRRKDQPREELHKATTMQPHHELLRTELQQRVRDAIERLPEHERVVLIMSEYNGLKYHEIADVLEIPLGTVKSRVFSSVNRLREMLGPYLK